MRPSLLPPPSRTITEKTKVRNGPAYFADMVSYTDYRIGRLPDHLDKLGVSDNTLACL